MARMDWEKNNRYRKAERTNPSSSERRWIKAMKKQKESARKKIVEKNLLEKIQRYKKKRDAGLL